LIKALFRFIGGVFRYAFRTLDVLRRLVLNLAFLLVIAVLVGFFFWLPGASVPEGAALVLRPSGALVEQERLESPLELISRRSSLASQSSLRTLVEAVSLARNDPRIAGLVIETDDLGGGGIAKLAELREAIDAFRESGKPVLARGERFTEGQYFLASVADEVHLSPDGFVLLRGLARYQSYVGNALERLGVKLHVFRVGEYKSMAEMFSRNDMSDEDRDNTRDLLAGLWSHVMDAIATSRDIDPDALERHVGGFDRAIRAVDGNMAMAAVEAGLITHLSTRDQWRDELATRFGPGERERGFRAIGPARYLEAVPQPADTQGKVAVLVAQGAIMDGRAAPGGVAGDAFARLIRDAREDPQVRALVVRIDSPGGSAWASELIRRELELTRRVGKPVVASMSSTAASGGYWIAAGADEIHAHPMSLTGSIGIFAMFPDLSEPMERLGITVDGVATGPFAGVPDPRRPLSDEAKAAMQSAIEHGYDRFIETVAYARGMSEAEVDLVARGRVYTGEAAHKLGLVDQLGGLDGAIDAAAQRAGLERYEVIWPETQLSPRDRLLRRVAGFVGIDTPRVPTGSPFEALFASIQREASVLLTWNDPRHMYAHCLCEGP
jgi:protease-4